MAAPIRTEPDQFPVPLNMAGNFYRHADGGCYQVLSRGRETETDVEMVAYLHRYPFDLRWSFRTAENFDGMTDSQRRFTPISVTEAERMMSIDRKQAQDTVHAARAARRASRPAP